MQLLHVRHSELRKGYILVIVDGIGYLRVRPEIGSTLNATLCEAVDILRSD